MEIYEFSGEEFEHVSREAYYPVISRTGRNFRGRAELHELGEAALLSRQHWAGGPVQSTRTERMIARTSPVDLILFGIYMAGMARVRQRDRCAKVTPGSGVLVETRSAVDVLSPTDETQILMLHFPRELLPLRSAEITEACARSMDPTAPALQMLSGYLGRLFEVADDLTALQQQDAGRAAVDLLAMALRGVTPSAPGGDGPDDVLLEMMRTHIRKHLADPDLRVEELARRHHVSVSRMYTLFERIGTTPGAYLREQRLLAARTMLIDPKQDRLALSSIAAAVGFSGLNTFERAFRRQYGTTPAGWRREQLSRERGPR